MADTSPDAPFDDAMFDDMAREHAGEPPSPLGLIDRSVRGPHAFGNDDTAGFAEEELEDNEWLGQVPGVNPSGALDGVPTDNDLTPSTHESLLTEGFPSGSGPTAATDMPPMWHGSATRRRFSGRNDTMPPGAVQYVGRDEERSWGDGVYGPNMVGCKCEAW